MDKKKLAKALRLALTYFPDIDDGTKEFRAYMLILNHIKELET